jgi:hypothetical protein
MKEELSTRTKIHDEEEIGARLESPVELDQKGVFKLLKNLTLA